MLHPNVKQAIETLIAYGYAIIHQEVVTLTDKVLELDSTALINAPPAYTKSITLLNSKDKSVIPSPGEQSMLVKFIIDCEVPQKIRAADGKSYWACKYSKEAEKELSKIILKQGYKLDILTAATKLYYKSANFCETITNYITRGTWLTFYMEMEKQLNAGTVEKHIQSNLSEQKGGSPIYDER